jgi:hypothetical protein
MNSFNFPIVVTGVFPLSSGLCGSACTPVTGRKRFSRNEIGGTASPIRQWVQSWGQSLGALSALNVLMRGLWSIRASNERTLHAQEPVGAGYWSRAMRSGHIHESRPPRRSRLMVVPSGSAGTVGSARKGAAWLRLRCGRWVLKWDSYSRSTVRAWAMFRIRIRSRSSRADAAHDSFADRVRAGVRARDRDDFGSNIGEHGVEGGGEFGVPIPSALESVLQ